MAKTRAADKKAAKEKEAEQAAPMTKEELEEGLARISRKAEEQDSTITGKDLQEVFQGRELDDEAMDAISQYLDDHDIVLAGSDDESQEEENGDEKELSDAELQSLSSDIDNKTVSDDDASEEDLEEIEKQEEEKTAVEITPEVSTEDPVRMYLKEIGRIPLLKSEEEISLAKRMETGRVAKKILDAEFAGDDADTKTVTDQMVDAAFLLPEPEKGAEDTREADYAQMKEKLSGKSKRELQNIVSDGQDARNSLTEANLRLVVSIAKKYVNQGMSFLDLIQEGNTGLIKAVDKFDYRKGFKFSTYATWWIRQAITRAIADQARTIRVPVHMVETVNSIRRQKRELTVKLGRDPTDEELADAMGMPLQRLHEIMNETMEATSLDTPVGEEDDSSVGDFVADTTSLSPQDAADYRMLQQRINEVLGTLSEREQQVLRLRFGLDDGEPRTLEDVGRMFGVTRERIRQIEAKALRKLHHPSRGKKLRDFMDSD